MRTDGLSPAEAGIGLRIAARLDTALNEARYPVRPTPRRRMLANDLGWEVSTVATLLSGQRLPSVAELVQIGAQLNKDPGFFLDPNPVLPPDTCIARSLDDGEPMVLRLPSEIVSAAEAARGLSYAYAYKPMGFGVQRGEYIVSLTPAANFPAVPGQLYILLDDDEGAVLRRCISANSDRAAFKDSKGAVLLVNTQKPTVLHAPVVACLTPRELLLTRVADPKQALHPDPPL